MTEQIEKCPVELWGRVNTEKPLVVCDGMGGLAVADCSPCLAAAIKETGVCELLKGEYMKQPGVYRLLLSRDWQNCDCKDGMPCGHAGCWVFGLLDARKMEMPNCAMGVVSDDC